MKFYLLPYIYAINMSTQIQQIQSNITRSYIVNILKYASNVSRLLKK